MRKAHKGKGWCPSDVGDDAENEEYTKGIQSEE